MPGTRLLGQAYVAGRSIQVPVTNPTPAAGMLQLFYASLSETTLDTSGDYPNAASDPSGTTWHLPTISTTPLVGMAGYDTSWWSGHVGGAPIDQIQVGSIVRACATDDLHPGDLVEMDLHAAADGGTMQIEALLVYVPSVYAPLVTHNGGGSANDDANGFPDDTVPGGATFDRVIWNPLPFAENVAAYSPYPDADAVLLTAAGSRPGSRFTPVNGGTVYTGEHGMVNAVISRKIPANTVVEPGGSFATPSDLMVVNWQFVEPFVSGVVLHHTHKAHH